MEICTCVESSLPHMPSAWEVCGDCHRAYRRGENRASWALNEDTGAEELVEHCHYPNCAASPRFDGVDWASLAHAHPHSLPHIPERGVRYEW